MKKVVFLALVFLVVTVAILFLTNQRNKPDLPSKPVAPPVEAKAEVKTSPAPEKRSTVQFRGEVVAEKAQDIRFTVGGALEKGEQDFATGSAFRKNQLLFQVNNADAFSVMQENRRALQEKIQAVLPQIRSGFPAELSDWEQFYASLEQVSLIAGLPAATGELHKLIASKGIVEDHQKIRQQEARMADYFYIAPFDGVVTERLIEPGQKAGKGQTVARIARTDVQTLIRCELPSEALQAELTIIDEHNKRVGKGKIVKSKQLQLLTEAYIALENGKKLPAGTEVYVEFR